MVTEKKDKLNEKNKEDMKPFKDELTLLRISLYAEKLKKRIRRRLKFMKNKLIARKKKEAFPRKSGKYNELFQDLAKESGSRDNSSIKTT